MKQFSILRATGTYTIMKLYPGHPHAKRTGWTFSDEDVKDAAPVSTTTLAKQQTLNIALTQESVRTNPSAANSLSMIVTSSRVPKRPRDDGKVCKTKRLWSVQQINQSVDTWIGMSTNLKMEAASHGVSQSGTMKQVLGRLREHYALSHPVQTRRARSKGIAAYFNPSSPR